MATSAQESPLLSEFGLDFLGSWTGYAIVSPAHRISVMYVSRLPRRISLLFQPLLQRRAETLVRKRVEHILKNEWNYRLTAARAWLSKCQLQANFARGWNAEDLARRFVLHAVLLGGGHSTFIVEYVGVGDKALKTWFNADGTLSHISGDVRDG